MKSNCNHCIKLCKEKGRTECVKYISEAENIKLIQEQQKKSYCPKRQEKLDFFYYGRKINL